MGPGPSNEDEEITGINVTPMVDVVLVLLIIFMVTANFIAAPQGVDVDLPHASQATATAEGPLHIAVDRKGAIWVNQTGVSEQGLREKVAAAAQASDARAIVSADQALPYGQVMHLLDVVRGAGITRFALSIEKDVQPSR
jgi:biopolymer transport protein ExbD